jgi:two-component system CheB/CheR fusion protein
LLPEILAKSTQLPVEEVRHETRVEADHVYVVGRGHNVSIRDGSLQLEEPLERGIPPLPIDHFIRSLAREIEIIEAANRKLAAINAAFDTLRKERGF